MISKAKVVGVSLLIGILLGVIGYLGVEVKAAASSKPLSGESVYYIVWPYAMDVLKAQIAKFEEICGIPVVLETFPSGEKYTSLTASKIIAGERADVIRTADYNFLSFIEAGWLKPLPQKAIANYLEDLEPAFKKQWYRGGKLWGLPYYTSAWTPVYNKEIWEEAGIGHYPTTWEELKEQALKIKALGIFEYPMVLPLIKQPYLGYQLDAMVFSEGGHLFDSDLNPILHKPGSVFIEKLQWLIDAMYKWDILDPRSTEVGESEVWKIFAAEKVAMTMCARYRVQQMNNPAVSKVVGKTAVSLIPGRTHETVSWSRALTMTKVTRNPERTWTLIEFLSGKHEGKYMIPIDFLKLQGLDSAYKSLWEDPGIIEAINKWGDVRIFREQNLLARGLPEGPWTAKWFLDYRSEISRALAREITPQQAAENIANSWNEGRKEFPDFKPSW